MKKLLGLLAVAPMALAACGGSDDNTTTKYFLGHGKYTSANGLDGATNDKFNVIKASVKLDGDKLSYEINESTGYYQTVLTGDQVATPEWTATPDNTTGISGTQINTIWGAGTVTDESVNYTNSGESLRFAYEVVEVKSADKDDLVDGDADDVNFVNKTTANYGTDDDGTTVKFDWDMNKTAWEKKLNETYSSCEIVNAITQEGIDAWASHKASPAGDELAGATASESTLYIAAAITTAKAKCA